METSRLLPSDRGQTPGNVGMFGSVGGHLAKSLGLSDYNSPDINISKTHGDLTQNISRMKQEFLPFLQERDGLNRLLTVPSKYDPNKLEQPSNPMLYYKAERFNKARLRFGQAERNQQALGKMLQYSTDKESEQNILEMNKTVRMQKLANKKQFFSTKQSGWLETETDQPSGFQKRKQSLRIDTFGDESPKRKALTENNSPTLMTGFKFTHNKVLYKLSRYYLNFFCLKPGTAIVKTRKTVGIHINPKNKSEQFFNKPFFKKTDTFTNFYKKLDNDKRNITTSSTNLRTKAQTDVHYLNHVAKKFDKITQQYKKEEPMHTMSSFAMPSFRIEEEECIPLTQPTQESQMDRFRKTLSKGKPKFFLSSHMPSGNTFLKKRFAN